jgi:hypothetical protein
MDPHNKRFHIIATLVTIAIMVAIVWIHVYSRSKRYYREGETHLAENRLIEAVTSFETSAHSYTPGNPWVSRSMDRLWEIGQKMESEYDDPMYPLIAYRALRSSVYAIRSVITPYEEWIPKCDNKIKFLVDQQIREMEQMSRQTH